MQLILDNGQELSKDQAVYNEITHTQTHTHTHTHTYIYIFIYVFNIYRNYNDSICYEFLTCHITQFKSATIYYTSCHLDNLMVQ